MQLSQLLSDAVPQSLAGDPRGEREPRRMRLPGLVLTTLAAFAFSAVTSMAEAGAPPASFAELAARVTPAVVNISSTHTVSEGGGVLPDLDFNFPPGSPFEEFFKKFREQPIAGHATLVKGERSELAELAADLL